jgi:hypothetical protein
MHVTAATIAAASAACQPHRYSHKDATVRTAAWTRTTTGAAPPTVAKASRSDPDTSTVRNSVVYSHVEHCNGVGKAQHVTVLCHTVKQRDRESVTACILPVTTINVLHPASQSDMSLNDE